MFNVSALLLDDALKPATPLTNENQLIFDEVKAYKKIMPSFWANLMQYLQDVTVTLDNN